METMERYSYSIHPFRTITNVIPGKGIRKPMTLKLTKEEVLKCMEKGPVYRAFPDRPYVRVTRSNLDSLHVSTLEDDIKPKTSNHTEIKEEAPQTETIVPEEPKNEASTEVIEEEKQEVEENIVTEDVIKEEIPETVTETTDSELVEVNIEGEVLAAEASVEEQEDEDPGDLRNEEEESKVVEDEEEVEPEEAGQPLQPISSNNYNRKKNKHKH